MSARDEVSSLCALSHCELQTPVAKQHGDFVLRSYVAR